MSTAHSGTFVPAENPEWPLGTSELLQLLRKRVRLVLRVAAAVVLIAILVLLVWPSRYSSTAVVMLDPRRNNITDRTQVLTELPTDPASVQNQIQILTSRDLATAVVDRLQLSHDPEFNRPPQFFPLRWLASSLDSEARRSAIIDVFLKHLSVESEGLSTAVSITVSASDPDKAARIANAVVGAYIGLQIQQKAEAARRTTFWLNTRIGQLARQMQNDDAAVQSYKIANGLNDSGQGTQSLVDQQLSAINNQLIQARADLVQKQATYDHVEALVKSGRAAQVSQVVVSPLIVQLRQQQAEAIRNLADIETRYGAKHPKRVAAESQLRDLDNKIEQEAERVAGAVANDLAVARAQVQSLENSLSSARVQSNAQNLARVKLRALEAGAASTRSMYGSFVARVREVQDQDGVTVPDARVISHASVPAAPSSPPRLLIFCASVPAGLLLGLLCALMAERAAAPARESPATTNSVAVPIVARIPDSRDLDAADLIVSAPSASFSRAMLGLADRVVSASSPPRTILVSGFGPRDAVANIAVGLARTLVFLGHNVVLVDADLTRCAAARIVGFGAAGGMLDVLNGKLPLSRAISKDRSSGVVVLAGHQAAANAGTDWQSGATRALLDHLARASDFVVIHAPAHLDMLPLMAMAEGVLFVGAAGDALSVARTAASFARNARHLGIVLAA